MKTEMILINTNAYGEKENTYRVTTDILGDIEVTTTKSAEGWTATEGNYDGPEDKVRTNHSQHSEIDAMQGLIDKMEEWKARQTPDQQPGSGVYGCGITSTDEILS